MKYSLFSMLVTMIPFCMVAQTQGSVSKAFPKNRILVRTQGEMKIKNCYLLKLNGDSVGSANVFGSFEKFYLVVELEKGGWVEKNSLLKLGASIKVEKTKEKTREDRGETETIMEQKDFFENSKGITAEEATLIKLQASVDIGLGEGKYLLRFNIWDKNDETKMNYISGNCSLLVSAVDYLKGQ